MLSDSRQVDGTVGIEGVPRGGVYTKVSVRNQFIGRVAMVSDSRQVDGTVSIGGVRRRGLHKEPVYRESRHDVRQSPDRWDSRIS